MIAKQKNIHFKFFLNNNIFLTYFFNILIIKSKQNKKRQFYIQLLKYSSLLAHSGMQLLLKTSI